MSLRPAEAEGMRGGLRAAAPLAPAVFLVGVSFGIAALPVMGAVAPVVMSAIVHAGSAQFAALAVLADGGGAGAAIVAGILLNLRFLPMAVAYAPWIPGGALRRAAEGQATTDASWAIASRGGGRFDRDTLLGATLAQYPAWLLGTLAGVLIGEGLGDPRDVGLDAIFPAFFLALLVEEARGRRGAAVAVAGAVVALALSPLVPPGIPVLAASVIALVGLRGERP